MSNHFDLMRHLDDHGSHETSSYSGIRRAYLSDGAVLPARFSVADDESLQLVQRIFLHHTDCQPRVVIVVGIDHGNGSSQVAASIAETLAKNSQQTVCLVQADLRSAASPKSFRSGFTYGLTDALKGTGSILTFTKSVNATNLSLLSAGTLEADSPNLLTSERLMDRWKELRQSFDYVVVDAPPLSRYSDGVILGQLSDGIVLVLEADSTRREAAADVMATLRSANVPILAAILNKRTFPIPSALYRRL